jgi:23S rRNA pseudouridine1911/1915/1917 synthase
LTASLRSAACPSGRQIKIKIKKLQKVTHETSSAFESSGTFTVPESGERLDQWLAGAAPRLSRSRWQELIREGLVQVNGNAVKPNAKLRAGDRVDFREPPAVVVENARPEEIPLAVLYEDADLVVIDKPAGMVVHPAAGHWEGTAVNALLHHCGELSVIGGEHRPGIVHRLDRETSGCLVVAKNDAAHQALAKQFASRTVRKIYLAIAAGPFRQKSGEIEAAIGRHPTDRKKMAVLEKGRARPARTSWRVLQELSAGAALVECTLHTGRTHQIRVHLKHIGHPLLGDAIYGKRAGFARQMLHAWKLGFAHPRTGVAVECVAPVPGDFLAAGVEAPD